MFLRETNRTVFEKSGETKTELLVSMEEFTGKLIRNDCINFSRFLIRIVAKGRSVLKSEKIESTTLTDRSARENDSYRWFHFSHKKLSIEVFL